MHQNTSFVDRKELSNAWSYYQSRYPPASKVAIFQVYQRCLRGRASLLPKSDGRILSLRSCCLEGQARSRSCKTQHVFSKSDRQHSPRTTPIAAIPNVRRCAVLSVGRSTPRFGRCIHATTYEYHATSPPLPL